MNKYIVPAALTTLFLFIAQPLLAGKNTLLLKAVSVRHQNIADYSRKTIPQIQQCLDAGADIGTRNVLGRNAVHILLETHSGILKAETRDVLAYLIERGADVNASDCYGMTPLHIAENLRKKTRDSIGNCTNCGWMERNIDDMSKTLEMLRKAGVIAGEQPFRSARNEITPEPPAIPGGNDPDGMLIRAVEAGDHTEMKRAMS